MLTAIREFFDRHIASQPDEAAGHAMQRLRVAAAVLLVEVARSDHEFTDAEREAVLETVRTKFGLGPEEAAELLALAEAESREAHDLYQFVSRVDASFSMEEKVKLIEEMWRAAHSDTVLHANEEHLIRRVADMLHLPHSRFIGAKLRALAEGRK